MTDEAKAFHNALAAERTRKQIDIERRELKQEDTPEEVLKLRYLLSEQLSTLNTTLDEIASSLNSIAGSLLTLSPPPWDGKGDC